MRWAWAAALGIALAGCETGFGDPAAYVERIRANPSDTGAMAELAVIGAEAVPGLLGLVAEGAEARRAALATLVVAGDPCGARMIEAFDQGERDDVRRDILAVLARGKWRGAVVRKLAGRLEHGRLGEEVYFAIAEIMAPEPVPENPWVGGSIDERRLSEWNRWMGLNAASLGTLSLRETKWARAQTDEVKALIESELPNW